ncbi:MAG: aminotransferase class V-fold PLP-dependent enzyme [Ruminiclostridium sp.]|nr:aminotransferase class V-fold PLP-dependent enzyme [Ruminiclostridium sp.]
MKTPIHDFLEGYAKSGTVRLHMPGGKGLAYPYDITEITGADELYDCAGMIRESERSAAELFGAAETCYSCGGSTLAIQAMLSAACEVTGKHKIAAGRFSHKSLVNAAILLDLDITWIYPDDFLGCRLSPEAVEAAVDSDTAAVFVNAVDYLGGEADIAALSAVCKKHGVLLLADNAHGAYKVFTGDHPIKLGADMTADSAHKTLPAITGTAYLHLADSAYYEPAKKAMSLFGSSSPSYLMLDSLDLCNAYIAERSIEALKTIELVRTLKEQLTADGAALRDSDAMRITVDANAIGYSGYELAAFMRENGAECEMSGARYVVLLFSVVQPERDFGKVRDILRSIPKKAPVAPERIPVLKPRRALSPREAFFSRKMTVPAEEAVGRICAGVHSPCPPCVPVIMPGETVSEEAAELLHGHFGVTVIDVVRRDK